MSWREELIQRLREKPCCGYGTSDTFATEPSSLTALALLREGRMGEASLVGNWLAGIQSPEGSVGIRASESEPCWPTSLAVLVWAALRSSAGQTEYSGACERAVNWILSQQKREERSESVAHDPSLAAWPWVEGTHSWVEPTSLHVLALRATGHTSNPCVLEAMRMLVDRQLPGGGWNYGNTVVLKQELRAHVQPTGIALLALGRGSRDTSSLEKSLLELRNRLTPQSSTLSLCWGLLGLAAHGQSPASADEWLAATYQRLVERDRSPLKFALIALALQAEQSLLVTLPTSLEPTPRPGKKLLPGSGA